ncbi:MAG: respiratory nitrate reductase subunit gamma [Deltaproteobacteria bacterium]|nr:respiratory nitrate reductase subunit gamma [Deltaproteobacteria bacterium]
MGFLQFLTYLSGLVFVIAFAAKLLKYATMPMHVRWELYPIPHEGKEWGGSFYEEVDHWKKTRHKDHMAQYRFMVPEILFIRALHEDNKPLWYWSFPFHMGLYLCIGGLVFLGLGAVLQIFGMVPENSALASLVQSFTIVFAVPGFILGALGSIGLIVKRMTDANLTDVTAGIDYMNLIWLGLLFLTGFIVWLQDPGFGVSRAYLKSLITFGPMTESMGGVHIVNLLLFIGFWAYFPFTHMTHMVSKYFMWDKVKWDDDPNRGDAGMDSRIKTYLSYPVTWAAAHVDAQGGKKSWAEVATTNPWETKEQK